MVLTLAACCCCYHPRSQVVHAPAALVRDRRPAALLLLLARLVPAGPGHLGARAPLLHVAAVVLRHAAGEAGRRDDADQLEERERAHEEQRRKRREEKQVAKRAILRAKFKGGVKNVQRQLTLSKTFGTSAGSAKEEKRDSLSASSPLSRFKGLVKSVMKANA